MDIGKIKIGSNCPNEFNMIVEIPAGVPPVKYEIDKDSNALVVDRFVGASMFYPCHYGFIPHTLANDGDPLDVLLVANFPVVPMSVINVRPIGVLLMDDESGGDEKIIAVPVDKVTTFYSKIKTYEDLPDLMISQIRHFFENYKGLEPNKWVKIKHFDTIDVAKNIILTSIKNYK